MKIGEIASEAGVSVDTVRFYERVGVLPPAGAPASGYREYEPGRRANRAHPRVRGSASRSTTWSRARRPRRGRRDLRVRTLAPAAVLERVDAKLAELKALRGRIVDAQARVRVRALRAPGSVLFERVQARERRRRPASAVRPRATEPMSTGAKPKAATSAWTVALASASSPA